MSGNEVTVVHERLTDVTAKMLGIDPGAPRSAADSLKIGVASVLLLEIDGFVGKSIAGQDVDLSRLNTAMGLLSKLIPASAERPVEDTGGDAREKLSRLFEGMAAAREHQEQELRTEVERLRADNERLKAAAAAASAAPPAPEPAPPPAAKSARAVPGLVQRTPESELARLASREVPGPPASSEGFTSGSTDWRYGGRFAAIGGPTRRPYGM